MLPLNTCTFTILLLGVSLKIVQLLQHFEHLVQPLAQAVETFVNEFSVKSIVSEVIRWVFYYIAVGKNYMYSQTGSWALRISVVKCQSIPTINHWSTLIRPFINLRSTLDLDQHLIDPRLTLDQPLINTWSTLHQPSINPRSILDQPLINTWSTLDWPLIDPWSTFDQLSIYPRSILDQSLLNTWSTLDQPLIDPW